MKPERMLLLAVLVILAFVAPALGQGGYNDDRVMIQGFMWESHQSGRQRAAGGAEYDVDWQGKWYDHAQRFVGRPGESRSRVDFRRCQSSAARSGSRR